MIGTRTRDNAGIELEAHIAALTGAGRRQHAATWALRSLAAGLGVDVLLMTAARLGTLPVERSWLTVPPIVLLVAVLLATMLRRPAPLSIAQIADRELGLQERLTTAVEMSRGETSRAFAELQLADTLAHLRRHTAAQAFPYRAKRGDLAVLMLAVTGLAAFWLWPPAPRPSGPSLVEVQETIKQEAERVAALAEEIEVAKAGEDEATRGAVAKTLRDASGLMEKQTSSPEKAIAALTAAERSLSAKQSLRAEDLRQAMDRAAEALRRESATRPAGTSLAQGDAAGAAEGLRALGESAAQMSAAQRAAAAQALRSAANNATPFDPRLGESLREAADALAENDAGAQRALAQAADSLKQAGQEVARQQVVEKALSELERSRATIGNAARPGVDPEGEEPRRAQGGSSAGQQAGPTSSTGKREQSGQGEDDGTDGSGGRQGEPGGSGAGTGSINRSDGERDGDQLRARDEQAATGGFERPSVSASERTLPPDGGEALVDYRDVYATYRDRATAATQDRYIPLNLKELVKDYFSALDPSR